MKTHDYNPFEKWNTIKEERRIQRARDAGWRELRRQQRRERKIRMPLPAFGKRNIHILLIAIAALTVLFKGLTSAMAGGSSLTSLLCVILFVILAILFRAVWRKDRFENHFKKRF